MTVQIALDHKFINLSLSLSLSLHTHIYIYIYQVLPLTLTNLQTFLTSQETSLVFPLILPKKIHPRKQIQPCPGETVPIVYKGITIAIDPIDAAVSFLSALLP